jgi:predicted nuclease of predicted toxin-antitoxin system
MKVLLDENLPQDLRYFLPEHQVSTVGSLHWHISNDGRLLERAATFGFDVFVTHDPGQLRLAGGNGSPPAAVSVIALRAPTNTMDDVRPLVVPLLEALNAFRPNTVMAIPE